LTLVEGEKQVCCSEETEAVKRNFRKKEDDANGRF